jgi:hydroxymethylglutaryl-CoA synthase
VLIGLASILEKAKTDDRILMVSYGSGAGSDAFDIRVTDAIESLERAGAESLKSIIENHRFISYATYAKYMGKIHLRGA